MTRSSRLSSVLELSLFVPPRRSPRLLLLLALAFSLGLLGCSGPSSTQAPSALPSAFPNHSADQIRTRLQQPSDTLRRYAAEARVSVRTPSENRSFNAQIRQEKADSLFMRFSLFGFEGGRMLLTPDSVFFYDSRKQTLRVGPVAKAQQILPAPVASDEVFDNMLGLVSPDGPTDWTVTADSTRYYLSDPEEHRRWTVDPRHWRVVRFTRTDGNGTILEERRFSNFHTTQGLTLPRRVIFKRPQENLRAQIDYKQIQLNPSRLSFTLGVPSNVPRRPLR